MIPLSISMATTIKIGYANGAKNLVDIKRYSLTSCIITESFMLLCGVIIAIFPTQIVKMFTPDTTLIRIMIPVMILLAIFEITDGLQVILGGIFKGMKNTNIVMVTNIIGYLIIGMPLGIYLALNKNLNLVGFWIGLVVASVILCSLLSVKLGKSLKNYELVSDVECPQGD